METRNKKLFRVLVGLLLTAMGVGFSLYFDSYILFLITLLTSLFVFRVAILWQHNDASFLFSPDIVVASMVLLYFVPPALDAAFGGNSLNIEERVLTTYLMLATLFLFFFVFAFSRPNLSPGRSSKIKHVLSGDFYLQRNIAIIILTVGVLLYFYFISDQFGSVSAMLDMKRMDVYKQFEGAGIFLISVDIVKFSWLFLFALHLSKNCSQKTLMLHYLGLIVFSAFFMLQGERGTWATLLISMLFIYAYYRQVNVTKVIILGVLGIVFLEGYGRFRWILDSPALDIATLIELGLSSEFVASSLKVDFSGSDTGAHYMIARDLLQNDKLSQPILGLSYLHGFINLVPTFVWPDRSEFVYLPNVEYLMNYLPEKFSKGGGLAYSFVIESYINFSYLGPIIIGTLLGAGLKKIYRFSVEASSMVPLKLVLYSAILGNLVLIVRSQFAGLLKSVLVTSVAPYLIILVIIIFLRSAIRIYPQNANGVSIS